MNVHRKSPEPSDRLAGSIEPVTIRPMGPADIGPVMTIESAARSRPWTRAMFEDDLSRASRRWLVAVAADTGGDGALLGFGGIMIAGDEIHVMDIAVDPEVRGTGVGRALLARLLTAGLELGASSATLEVGADNEPAIGLYRRFGFVAEGRRPRYYGDGVDAVIMWARDLNGDERRRWLREMAEVSR